MTTTLVLGGVRSGKSRYAEQLACSLSSRPIYLATSRIWDEDHRQRVARHQRERGPEWDTVEVDKELSAAVETRGRVVLVECVTLWLTNYFVDFEQDVDIVLEQMKAEFDRAVRSGGDWIFVSNEVGMSLHASTEMGRKFTDAQGFLNQFIAARAERVTLMVAGIPVNVKGKE